MKRTGTELKNKMSRQERREARLRQEKLRLQKKSKLTLIVYAVIRLIVVGVLVRSAFNGQIESVYTCLLTLVLLLLPSILERKLGVRLPAGLEITVVVFIFAAEILGEIACFYVTVPFWDKALHTTSGFIYAAVGYSMADVLNRHKKVSFELSPLFLALVAFCFSMTIGALWEIFEFSVDNLFHKDMQKDTVIQQITSVALDPTNRNIPITISNIQDVVVNGESLGLGGYLDIGLYDTMGDLIVNLIGAVVFSVIGYFHQKHRKKSVVTQLSSRRWTKKRRMCSMNDKEHRNLERAGKADTDRILTIPNVLSFFRLALIPVIIVLYAKNEVWWAFGMLVLSGVTDVVDGWVARTYHMVSNFGKAIDPVADKLTQIAVLLCLMPMKCWWVVGILVLKEVSIGIMTLLTLHHTGMVYGAGWYGKLCTAVIYLSRFVLMLWRTAPDWFLYADAALCACLILLAFVKYAIRYGGILREARADGARKQA